MQDFRYNYIESKYGDKAKMLQTDTDSLMRNISAESFYEHFYKGKELFDFSNYPENSEHYNNAINLFISKMKDETCGVSIKSLKSKMFTFITEDNHESKKAKGINKNVVDMNYNMKFTKILCLILHIRDMKWAEFEAKILI